MATKTTPVVVYDHTPSRLRRSNNFKFKFIDQRPVHNLVIKITSTISSTRKHHSLSYREVWNALKILDASDVDNPEASSGIVEIYSLKVVLKSLAGKPEGWNREHLWPRSYGLKKGPSPTDVHNICPADVNVNSSRGNKYYGECGVTSVKCLRPANKEAALDTETDKDRWAPPKQHRGDIARALMYMAVCYGYRILDGGPVLHLSDSPKISKNEMGLLSTLLKWNEIDPPSREEKLRNDRVCKLYQHNRNPFVDHPEYATVIWKEDVSRHHGVHPLPRNHQIQNKQGISSLHLHLNTRRIGVCYCFKESLVKETLSSNSRGNKVQASRNQTMHIHERRMAGWER